MIECRYMRKAAPQTVLVDMDDTIAQLGRKAIRTHNEEFGTSYTQEDQTSWGLPFIEFCLGRPGFFDDLEPMPGALETLTKLRERDFRILFLTSPFTNESAGSKYRWLERHFPWFSIRDAFMGHDKFRVAGDFLIDDSPKHLQKWATAWPSGKAMSIAYPYNQVELPTNARRFESWRNPEQAWADMAAYILDSAPW